MSEGSTTSGPGTGSRPVWLHILKNITVEPVVFLYMLGTFLLFSVFQNLLYTNICEDATQDVVNGTEVCEHLYDEENAVMLEEVQATASTWIKISTACMTVPSIVVDCYLGSWSDLFGRKFTLVLPPLGALFGSIVYCVMGEGVQK